MLPVRMKAEAVSASERTQRDQNASVPQAIKGIHQADATGLFLEAQMAAADTASKEVTPLPVAAFAIIVPCQKECRFTLALSSHFFALPAG